MRMRVFHAEAVTSALTPTGTVSVKMLPAVTPHIASRSTCDDYWATSRRTTPTRCVHTASQAPVSSRGNEAADLTRSHIDVATRLSLVCMSARSAHRPSGSWGALCNHGKWGQQTRKT